MRIIFTRSTTVLILLLSIETFAQNVGIGTNSPGYRLDVNGRMRIRYGANDANSAGIWLNSVSQIEKAFIGMEDTNYVGLYGINAGWRFSMNVNTGALKINGSVGSVGQVLHSNGGGTAPTWQSFTNQLYNNTNQVQTTAFVYITEGTETNIPGLTYTFALSGSSKVLILLTINVRSDACNLVCKDSELSVTLFLNNTINQTYHRQVPYNLIKETVNGAQYLALGAGTYTLQAKGSVVGPDVGVPHGYMIVQIIPQ